MMVTPLTLLPLVVLLTIMCGAESANLQQRNQFRALHAGQTITGSVGAALNAWSMVECSGRCTGDRSCTGYKFGNSMCTLVDRNTTESTGLEFQTDTEGQVYIKDTCFQKPCQNSGTCHPEFDSYQCNCAPGFTGEHCETNINECESTPCHKGATCADKVNAFRCLCVPGFTGSDCKTEIDECSSSPCQNDGTCVDGFNSYTCNCSIGFTGLECKTNVDDCPGTNPCQNVGTCVDGVNSYQCKCIKWFYGIHCETDLTPVYYQPFEDTTSMTLHRGASLVQGKISTSLDVYKEKKQYANLGDLSVACITIPDTCAQEGGSVRFWMNVTEPVADLDGVITSSQLNLKTGFQCFFYSINLDCWLTTTSSWAYVSVPFPGGWFHVVLTWRYPDLILYINGAEAGREVVNTGAMTPGDGRVVVGKRYTDSDSYYSSMMMDELAFWNIALTGDQVALLHNTTEV